MRSTPKKKERKKKKPFLEHRWANIPQAHITSCAKESTFYLNLSRWLSRELWQWMKHLNGLLYASYAIIIGVQLTRYKVDLKSYNSLLHNNWGSKTEQAQFDQRNSRVEVSSRKGDEAQVAGCRLKHTITKAQLKHSRWKGTSCSKILNVQ